ncbi:MAG: hypothetical protein O2923_07490 [Verrucomicrobia bacterium]|nr:hypothetical protein [Verrucomicrobiota bacterium]
MRHKGLQALPCSETQIGLQAAEPLVFSESGFHIEIVTESRA